MGQGEKVPSETSPVIKFETKALIMLEHDVAGLAKSYILVSKVCFLGLKNCPYL